MSIKYLESKFHSGGLEKKDCAIILAEIRAAHKYSDMMSLIYMFGYLCDENAEVMQLCDNLICNPVPGLTAVCMRVAIDYWNNWEKYENILKYYLDLSIYEEWYDEVIFTVSFIRRNENLPFSKETIDKLARLIADPRAKDLVVL